MGMPRETAEQLVRALEDLHFSVRSLDGSIKKDDEARPGAGGRASAAGAGRAPAPGGPPTSGGGMGPGFALSAARQVLGAAGGPLGSAASNVLSGLASGGLAGGAVAAGAAALNLGMQGVRAGQQAALNAPLFSGSGREAYEERYGQSSFKAGLRQNLDAFNKFNPFAYLLGSDTNAGVREQRALDAARAAKTAAAAATAQEVGSFLGNIAAAGGQVSNKQITDLSAQLLKQNIARFAVQQRVTRITNVLGGFGDVEQASHGAAK